ncbi:MAG: squalene/phytoene synthase family protein [Sphingomonadales bacterium]|nr:squalene/phytoene synthase family protein [Sphingomonadales bacterium]
MVQRLSECAALVRDFDRDRYLSALFAPAEKREGLLALYALNVELARIAEAVSEPMLGEIRLQWWREAVAGVFAGTVRDHPALRALHELRAAGVLDRDLVARLIEARTADLEEAPFATLDDLERYAADTAGALTALAARALDPHASLDLAIAAGTVWSLSGILRAVGYHAACGRVLLPRDLLAHAGVDPHDLIQGRPSAALADVAVRVYARAETLLSAVHGQRRQVSRQAAPAFLPLALARSDLAALRRAGFNPLAPRLRRQRPGRLLRLMWRGVRGRF